MYEPWGYQEENNYQSEENLFDIEFGKVFVLASYNKNDKKIHFFNNDGDELSDSAIDTTEFANGVVTNAYYDHTTKELVIEFDGGYVVRINMAEIIDENEFADGLQVNEGVVSVLIDSATEEYLSVSENGIKLSGVNATIDVEKTRAITAEKTINDKINDVISGGTPIAKLESLIEKLGYQNNDTLKTTDEHEVAFGEWNISHYDNNNLSGQTIFSIGNGTSDSNRSNAIEIMKDGSIFMWIEGEFMNINKILGQISHEVYDTNP